MAVSLAKQLSKLRLPVAVALGGTGSATQAGARTGLGLKTAAVADVVGPVSQVGGVPTGAIMEKGSNSGGEFIKFADGTLICWVLGTVTGSIPNDSGKEFTIPYPSTFSSGPMISLLVGFATGATNGITGRLSAGLPGAPGTTSARIHVYNTSGLAPTSFDYYAVITGRWY